MSGKLAKVDDWYTQTAKEFRQDVRKIISVYWANSWISKLIKKREWQGFLVVGSISLLGVLIKGEPKTPIYETIFDNLESIALGSAGVIFLIEIQDRKKRDQYEAWQVINLAQGKTGSGGRIQALQDLNKADVALKGVAAPQANLSGIDLSYGKLEGANFRKAQLRNAHLEGAILTGAHLEGAILIDAHLEGANLTGAHLEGASFASAHLEGANLAGTNLEGTSFWGAYLEGAKLTNSHLEQAKSLTEAQITQANLCRTSLPEGINLNPNRDCKKLKISLKEMDRSRLPETPE